MQIITKSGGVGDAFPLLLGATSKRGLAVYSRRNTRENVPSEKRSIARMTSGADTPACGGHGNFRKTGNDFNGKAGIGFHNAPAMICS